MQSQPANAAKAISLFALRQDWGTMSVQEVVSYFKPETPNQPSLDG